MVSPVVALPPGFDVTDPDLHAERIPFEEYALLRRSAPVWWNPQPRSAGGFDDDGFWVVSKHRDVRDVSRRSDVFSSACKGAIPRLEDNISPEEFQATLSVLINKDAPEHTKLRGLVSRLFTPRAIDALRPTLEQRAERIVAAAIEGGQGEFVREVASELPMQAIAELIGVPEEDRVKLFEWSNQMTGYDDADVTVDSRVGAAEILGYSYQLAETRRQTPGNDVVSRLLSATIDGERLTPEQFGFFVVMLAVAGNETTRNATTLGMMAFLENPQQWELFKAQRPATAVDEIVRYTTPLICLQRTALTDTVIGDTEIKAGQRVVMLYASANFDEDVFDNPERFDITRDPNPHLGFGGTGAHYCLGANLARLELEIIFNKIADKMPDISRLGDPARLRSGWINGIKRFHTNYRSGCPVTH
ncbi:cytochrome P450 [Mycobacterium heckeshornense]|uniref:Putative cytochrome P450 n=1 Tax=Mycobacterium heckeshornense TaxID=110505 RepID=A0A2G8BEV6_9MYCO|nr:cytochrome P450 [Mycobacterium heckeshornense]KMV24074.1 steroid C27-monooxygenase [Mycobacterium heckeshornense]MCV7036274.1 cytochrome P450 [Mycobacterium heckeshornense]PIJ36275.1 cytochrome P450 [Mycobacterium heckeshornense]BCO34129.1 putative cytochrome P450 [Mycobacterium heckeshornense]BCQ07180.1 putative cytochrome P450 [Mycobacterium heckeshornense]